MNECASKRRKDITMYYVIQVKTGKEETMIEDIKKQLKDLSDYDVFSPFRKSLRKFKGVTKEVTERCFPGYVFVNTEKPKELFEALYWTPGFTKLLGREGLTTNFVPLNKDESRMIDILYSANDDHITEISNIEVKEEQTIKVLDGPLVGLETRIKKVNLHKRMVTIEHMFCGRLVESQIGINIITDVINK